MQSSACSETDRITLRLPAKLVREELRTALQPSASRGGAGGCGGDDAARHMPGHGHAAAASAAHNRSQVRHTAVTRSRVADRLCQACVGDTLWPQIHLRGYPELVAASLMQLPMLPLSVETWTVPA